MRVALIGQPNCGKSTLFNQVAGYKAETGNFSGTTVSYTESRVRVAGEVIELVDLPGTYTLEGGSPAEEQTARYLDSRQVDVIVNVADSTHLASALELSLELLPLKKPVIVALNMMDEASRLGLRIDGAGLARELRVPALPLVASKGRGVKQLFLKSLEVGRKNAIQPNEASIPDQRHLLARELTKRFVSQGERRVTWRDRLDDVLLHPVWGYTILLLVLFLFFQAVYGIGKVTEPPLLAFFEVVTTGVLAPFGAGSLLSEIMLGIMQGITAGVAIVLPYLLPFLLGLGMLSAVEDCVEQIARTRTETVDLSRIPLDEPAVFADIQRADTVGCFQIESRAQMQIILRTRPETLDDIVVQVALVRPGPIQGKAVHPYVERRQRLREDPSYAAPADHPLLEEPLRETLGVVVFQDQVLEVAMALAGFSVGEAEGLRLVGHRWAPSAHVLRDFLARNQVPYRFLDIEKDSEAEASVNAAWAEAKIFSRASRMHWPTGQAALGLLVGVPNGSQSSTAR